MYIFPILRSESVNRIELQKVSVVYVHKCVSLCAEKNYKISACNAVTAVMGASHRK